MSNVINPRIAKRFEKLKAEKRAGLVTFTMAYDPDYDTSLSILNGLPEAGADIIELGMPFSDPMADGPAVEAAGIRALASGAKLAGILEIVAAFRATDQDTPIILMGYANPIYHYGLEAFATDAAKAGVDGLIIVDLPPEEDTALYEHASAHNIALIKLVTPTTDAERLQVILQKASGFLYYVSVAGITGTKSASQASIADALIRFKTHTSLPVVVGFGVRTPEQAKAIANVADGVVVGSALVNQVADGDKAGAKERLLNMVRSLSLR